MSSGDARARLSAILDEIEELAADFDEAAIDAEIPQTIRIEAVDELMGTVFDVREQIGDDMPDGKWIVAANPPKTLEEVFAARWNRQEARSILANEIQLTSWTAERGIA